MPNRSLPILCAHATARAISDLILLTGKDVQSAHGNFQDYIATRSTPTCACNEPAAHVGHERSGATPKERACISHVKQVLLEQRLLMMGTTTPRCFLRRNAPVWYRMLWMSKVRTVSMLSNNDAIRLKRPANSAQSLPTKGNQRTGIQRQQQQEQEATSHPLPKRKHRKTYQPTALSSPPTPPPTPLLPLKCSTFPIPLLSASLLTLPNTP